VVAPEIIKRYVETGKVKLVWHDFAWIGAESRQSAQAARCAGRQDTFWEYHDHLFNNQSALNLSDLKRYAAALSLNAATFDQCLDSSKHAERVRDGVSMGTGLGVNSTPTVYVNGRVLSGAQPLEAFVALIDEELARK